MQSKSILLEEFVDKLYLSALLIEVLVKSAAIASDCWSPATTFWSCSSMVFWLEHWSWLKEFKESVPAQTAHSYVCITVLPASTQLLLGLWCRPNHWTEPGWKIVSVFSAEKKPGSVYWISLQYVSALGKTALCCRHIGLCCAVGAYGWDVGEREGLLRTVRSFASSFSMV